MELQQKAQSVTAAVYVSGIWQVDLNEGQITCCTCEQLQLMQEVLQKTEI